MIRALFGSLTLLIVATAPLEASPFYEFELRNYTYNPLDTSSCVGRCGQGFVSGAPCQCNTACVNFGDCCADFNNICSSSISDQELRNLSEELLTLDAYYAINYVQVSLQGRGTGCNPDLAPNRLLTVNTAAYGLPTISRLMPLLDNYIADVNIAETVTPDELREENEFIDAIFATPVMQRAQAFLQQRGFPNGRANFAQIWFELYSRGTGALGSSGFEHVFLAETRDTTVLGGHGWFFFYEQETYGSLDYRGYRQYIPDIGHRGSVVSTIFAWRNLCKPISSMFIGTSPELELALFTVCFYSRSNALCPISLGGNLMRIQTYDITRSGRTFVGTAYPDIGS